jgi:hypothetical protein
MRRGVNLNKTFLRAVWILPNILLYIAFFFLLYFISSNFSGLKEINRLGIWVTISIFVISAAIVGSVRIIGWIKQGKI